MKTKHKMTTQNILEKKLSIGEKINYPKLLNEKDFKTITTYE